ncbi:MAG: formimidoylglutamase [Bacteroidales bacterium]|nr:formimidoylglutamase [Bacteroidales bacterium]
MKDIAIYFQPVTSLEPTEITSTTYKKLGEVFSVYTDEHNFPSLSGIDIAIVGVNDDRNAVNNEGCSRAADAVRQYLYKLFPGNYSIKLADLGNIRKGNSPEDTFFALTTVVQALLKEGIIPIIIGGGQDLTYSAYKAYKELNHIINLAAIDNLFDLGETEGKLNSQSYLSHIILHKPNYLFNFTNIGYQTYLVDQGAVDLMKDLFFDICRLGVAQASIVDIEPLIRNADMLTFDMSAIRQSDAPANANATPNGFYGEEACQISRYAGMSEKMSCIGFYEMNPLFDRNGQTAHLLAQMIWYFIDGFYHRQQDHPSKDPAGFIRYNVQLTNQEDGIVFFRSKKTDRWWMEVKCSESVREKYRHHYLVPCAYADYQTACENEMPDRWWQAYQKLM